MSKFLTIAILVTLAVWNSFTTGDHDAAAKDVAAEQDRIPEAAGTANRPDLTPAEYHMSRCDDDTLLASAIRLYFERDYEAALGLLDKGDDSPGYGPSRRSIFANPRQGIERQARQAAWQALMHHRNEDIQEAHDWARQAVALDDELGLAHKVLGYVRDPIRPGPEDLKDAELAERHYRAAVEARQPDIDTWETIWSHAVIDDDVQEATTALRQIREHDLYTPALMAFNKWVLHDVPPDGILITNGDMDTYPALLLQEFEDIRSDVIVVNASLLNLPAYALHIAHQHDIPWPANAEDLDDLQPYRSGEKIFGTSDQIVMKWLMMSQDQELARPLVFACTIPLQNMPFFAPADLTIVGGCYVVRPSESEEIGIDPTAIRSSLERLDVEAVTGSYSRYRSTSPLTANPSPLAGNPLSCAFRYLWHHGVQGNMTETWWALEFCERYIEASDMQSGWPEQLAGIRELLEARASE